MQRISILAIGSAKGSLYQPCILDYVRRMKSDITIKELNYSHKNFQKQNEEENKLLLSACKLDEYKIALDSNGTNLDSEEFAGKLSSLQLSGYDKITFFIGGSDGLNQKVLNEVDYTLSLGSMTWPHLLCRLMLIEQIYRAQEILSGKAYHR